MILTDVSQLPEHHKRELLRGERVQAELTILRQRRLKEACDLMDYRHVEGIGQRVMCIHPDLAARLRVRYGMNCLHDKGFVKRLLERNPFLRVRCAPAKVTVRVQGLKEDRSRARHGESVQRRTGDHVAQGEPAKPLDAVTNFRGLSGHETIPGPPLDGVAVASVSLAQLLPA